MSNMKNSRAANPLTPYLFIIPAAIVVSTFVLYPALKAIYLSFTNFNIISEAGFVGFANYINVWHDPFFWAALKNTLLYMIVVVPVLVFVPIFLAALVNKQIPGIALFRAAIYLPVITSLVISGLIWKWVYEEKGILNVSKINPHMRILMPKQGPKIDVLIPLKSSPPIGLCPGLPRKRRDSVSR